MKNILSIVKKELLEKIHTPSSYVVVGVFILAWEFLFFQNVFLINEASLRSLFSVLPWFLLLLVPSVTMGSVAEERSKNTLEFVLTHPVTERQFILGKYIAGVVFISTLLLVVFPIAWSLNLFGNVDLGVVFAQYLASILFVSTAVALGVSVSSYFKNQIAVLLVSITILFFMILLGFEVAISGLPLWLGTLLSQFSIIAHFDSLARGVIDIRDVWYFVLSTGILLEIGVMSLSKERMSANTKNARVEKITLAFLAIIFLLTTGFGYFLNGRIDLTEGGVYTLTPQTKQILSNLKNDVTITLYKSKNLPATMKPTVRTVQDVLSDYVRYSNGHVVVITKDPATDEDTQKESLKNGVQPVQFNVVGNSEFQVKKGYLGLSVNSDDDNKSIPFIQQTGDLEYQLTSFIQQLTATDKKKVVFVDNDSDVGLYGSQSSFNSLKKELEKQYDVVDVVYDDDGKAILPEDTATVVVISYSGELDDKVSSSVETYLNDGGSALFLVDTVDVNPQLMTASSGTTSAQILLEKYGVDINTDLVYDVRSNETVTVGGGMISYLIPYPYFIKAFIPENSAISARVRTVTMPWTSSMSIDDDKIKSLGLEANTLIKTSQYAGVNEKSFSINPQQRFSKDNLDTRVVGVQLLPENKSDDSDNVAPTLIVIGDVDFLTDQYGNNTPENIAFGLDAISWLTNSSSLGGIKVKNNVSRPFTFDNETQITVLRYGNMFGVLLVIVLAGVYVINRRRHLRAVPYK